MKKTWFVTLALAAGFTVGFVPGQTSQAATGVNAQAQKQPAPKVHHYKSTFTPKIGYRGGVGRPEGILIHETVEPNWNAATGAQHFLKEWPTKQTFVHAFVDQKEVAHIGDTNYTTWGAGTTGNSRFINIELCEVNNATDFAKSVNNLAYYTASLLRQYNLKPDLATNDGFGTIWSHYDVTRFLGGTDHTDPVNYFARFGYDMNQFYTLVTKWYNKLTGVKAQASAKNANVVRLGANTGLYAGPSYNYAKLRTLKKGTSWRYNQVQVTNSQYWFNLGGKQWVRVGGAVAPTLTVQGTSTLRTAPSYSAKAIRNLKSGSRFKYFDTRIVNNQLWYNLGGNQWVANGKTSGLTTVRKTGAKTGVISLGTALPMHAAASQSSKVVRTLAPGTAWQFSDVKKVAGQTWYWLGGNQWLQFN